MALPYPQSSIRLPSQPHRRPNPPCRIRSSIAPLLFRTSRHVTRISSISRQLPRRPSDYVSQPQYITACPYSPRVAKQSVSKGRGIVHALLHNTGIYVLCTAICHQNILSEKQASGIPPAKHQSTPEFGSSPVVRDQLPPASPLRACSAGRKCYLIVVPVAERTFCCLLVAVAPAYLS